MATDKISYFLDSSYKDEVMSVVNKVIKKQVKRMMPSVFNYLKIKRMKRFYSHFINEGDLCFDIGANKGNRTEIFLALGSSVVAVEPQDSCVKHLEKLFDNNKRVSVAKCALGEKSGTSEMFLSNIDEISTLSQEFVDQFGIANEVEWDSTQLTEVKTFDQLIEEYGVPDFTKIDVEGFETEVLKGLSVTIPALSFEFTAPFKYKAEECIYLLSELAQYRFNISYYESMKFVYMQWLTDKQMIQEIANIPSNILHGDIYAILSKS